MDFTLGAAIKKWLSCVGWFCTIYIKRRNSTAFDSVESHSTPHSTPQFHRLRCKSQLVFDVILFTLAFDWVYVEFMLYMILYQSFFLLFFLFANIYNFCSRHISLSFFDCLVFLLQTAVSATWLFLAAIPTLLVSFLGCFAILCN